MTKHTLEQGVMEMKKHALIMLPLLFISLSGLIFTVLLIKAESKTIYVDDDNTTGPWDGSPEHPYQNITSALTQALDGYTIFVYNGTYYERLIINKSVALIGQNKDGAIIDGNKTEDVIRITVNNVKITGFTIQNSGSIAEFSGIYVTSSGNNISHNIIKNNYKGIRLYYSANTTITDNDILDNHRGVSLSASNSIVITKNNILSNIDSGIRVTDSYNATISGNNISKSDFGIALITSNNSTFTDNNIFTNKYGIYTFKSENNAFLDNNISSNKDFGIWLSESTKNLLANNNIFSNDKVGIYTSGSTENLLTGNNIYVNNQQGIELVNSNNNILSGNTISKNLINGTLLYNSSDNMIFHNNFINNTRSLTSVNSINSLDNGIEGNYWSDYHGTDEDQDGIGNSPYIIDENNQDNYPLMAKFSGFTITYERETHDAYIISNSTISQPQFNETLRMLKFNVTGFSNTAGFSRITIPQLLINRPYIVLIDEELVNATILPVSNTTHTFLYFAYNHSTREVKIVSKPLYELFTSYSILLGNYRILNSTYYQLLADYDLLNQTYQQTLANYTQLLADYNTLKQTYWQVLANYTQLLANYTQLQADYNTLNQAHQETLTNYAKLQKEYQSLLEEHNSLNQTYQQALASYTELLTKHESLNQTYQQLMANHTKLQNDYSSIQTDYNTLLDQYNLLNSTHQKTESEYANTRTTLLYVSIAAIAITITTSSLTIKYNRRFKEQKKLVEEYKSELERISLLDAARAQFETDVQRRREKIEKFEQKYGIIVRPRNTLEDVIRSLELKKKRED